MGPLPLDPPIRRRAARSSAAHELGGEERAGCRSSTGVDAEGPGAQDVQHLGGEAAGIGGAAAKGVQEKGTAAGGRV